MKWLNNLVFISWAPDCSRSDSIAKRLGGVSSLIYSRFWGSRAFTILPKYVWQGLKTLAILFRERPRVVIVMTPPVVAGFPVWLYSVLTGAQFVVDAHTGAFLDRRWKKILFLHRFLSRRAALTMVTNQFLYDIVDSWRAPAQIVPDVPVMFPEPEIFPFEGDNNITLVSSFGWDEPTDVFLQAAASLPEVTFYVTGDYESADPAIIALAPGNVRFTGFLSKAQYVGLLQGSDAVMSPTTLDHTMQRGAYEAIYLGRPVIVSDFGILRDSFDKGAVYVENNAPAITLGVRTMLNELPARVGEALQLREEKLNHWDQVVNQLQQSLAGGSSALPSV